MKTCPNCWNEVEDNFDVCWSCQYSFVDEKVLDATEIKVVCPKCNAVVPSSVTYCPKCNSYVRENDEETDKKASGYNDLVCLRCKVPLEYQGNYKFHEGTRYGVMGDLFELLTNKESFDLCYCPKCGKVEFFLPGFVYEE